MRHKKRQNKSFCCSGPYKHTHMSLIIKWALVPQCYGSGLCTRGYTSWLPSAHMPVVTPDACWFSLYVNIYWGEIVEVQKTTRSTSEYKAILSLVVLDSVTLSIAGLIFTGKIQPFHKIRNLRESKKKILMQIWLLYALYGTMFYFCYPALFENSKSILYFSGNWKFDHLMHLCTYLTLYLRYFKIFWKKK